MKRKRELTGEEREVWFAVTRGVRPYHAAPIAPPAKHQTGVAHDHSGLAGSNARHMPASQPRHAAHAHPAPRPRAAEAGDPKIDRRAARGRIPIDATLDLHGHYQVSAHAALRAFISNARARGDRCVLVITGKGAQSTGSGILRRRFLEWVEERDLREQITRVANAHQRHGGGGAFYVFLKSGLRNANAKIIR